MVRVAAFAKACVVIGGCGIYHVDIHIVMLGQGKTATDYVVGVVALVGSIEMVVSGQDFLLDISL